MAKPLAIDLFCGLGGWTEGLLAEGWDVIGFDRERHNYGTGYYPAQLVLMDVLAIHGAMFAGADLIVASPPCQEFSYRAMPWKRAKALPPPFAGTNLFWQCWRIQQEACEAAGRYIPMVVENVKGAQKWIGRAKGHYGSFFLWGDVESVGGRLVRSGPVEFGMASVAAYPAQKKNPDGTGHPQGSWFKIADSKERGANATKVGGFSWSDYGKPDYVAKAFNGEADKRKREADLLAFTAERYPELLTESGHGENPDGRKVGKDWFGGYGGGFGWDSSPMRRNSSKSSARKAASAQIAKIPEPLARHIARIFKPASF